MNVVPIGASLRAWAGDLASEHFGSPRVVTRGRVHDVSRLPGLVACLADKPVGYLGYRQDGDECEIVVLVSASPGRGVGRRLLDEIDAVASRHGAERLVVVTTNDNVSAQRFYEACGFRLVATRADAVSEARRLKPEIPELGEGGVPIRDELEYSRPTSPVVVRAERDADADAIRAVHIASFPTASEADLVDALRAAGPLVVSLVAEVDGALVGHIGFSPVAAGSGAVGAGLAPVAVLATHRRRGIGRALVEHGLARCEALGFRWAVVLGDPRYYSRFGFRPASEFGLTDEYGGGAAFQAMALADGGVPLEAGLVRYAEEFAALG